MRRKNTKKIQVGRIEIGGSAPISVQSMTNTDTRDVKATIQQVLELENAGCDIVRIAIFDEKCVNTIKEIKRETDIPLVADIHFDHRLALASIENGIDKLRINPGNIGNRNAVKRVVDAAKERNIPIRIGVNAGSLSSHIINKFGNTPLGMVESAMEHVAILESMGYDRIVISLKASNVIKTVEAYRLISQRVDYPLHLGITEAGTYLSGTVKSSIGLGILLAEGIGDTIRVSLTASPVEEVKVGREILKALGLKASGVEIISCPTCGRCNIDLFNLTERLQDELRDVKQPLKVAVMGCVVNGPGEAREADIGIAGGQGKVALFKKGRIIGTVPEEKALEVLLSEIREMISQ
ncbi:MAG: flavodoxin-dependent (E)-4-hydroxy-3-methylbut-2-enyl-diphosphate synthase [Clostridiales bacterium]|jgi:(E)-4-hydroxy-3-methylbut-2-enyl-diphosphate synthase|nr:flavodoxin-dependent (E)-4-hydroxy-3-methylbut-2-enyl-diphosphate synthase [Clostridiales bacterium]